MELIKYELQRKRIKNIYIKIEQGKVIVKAPYKISKQDIEKIVKQKEKWIQRKLDEQKNRKAIQVPTTQEIENLKNKLEQYVSIYSKILDVKPNQIRIRNIKTAWGSCSEKKNITFSSSLAKKSNKFIEYVVVHELCHIKQMNHSKSFWQLVENNIPEYKKIRKEGRA